MLAHMLKCKELSDEEFNECYPDSYMECDFGFGNVIELCDGGSQTKLTRQNVDEYVELFVSKYFAQDHVQFAAF
jgi:hypothetical protein